jgi:hypothetical protein
MGVPHRHAIIRRDDCQPSRGCFLCPIPRRASIPDFAISRQFLIPQSICSPSQPVAQTDARLTNRLRTNAAGLRPTKPISGPQPSIPGSPSPRSQHRAHRVFHTTPLLGSELPPGPGPNSPKPRHARPDSVPARPDGTPRAWHDLRTGARLPANQALWPEIGRGEMHSWQPKRTA